MPETFQPPPESDWSFASDFFLKNPDFSKCKINKFVFIKINNNIYVRNSKNQAVILGEGGYGKVKLLHDKLGNNYALKIEKLTKSQKKKKEKRKKRYRN